MASYPLLEMEAAITKALALVSAIADIMAALQAESAGHYPMEATVMCTNVATARAALTAILPASLQTELAMEHLRYADDVRLLELGVPMPGEESP
jgi:hypothetical protein